MSCCPASRSPSFFPGERTPFIQKPCTKASLLVIALLFAGAAVVSHFYGLGIPGIVSFSVAGGVSLVVFALACVCGSKKASHHERIYNAAPPLSHVEQREVDDRQALLDAQRRGDAERAQLGMMQGEVNRMSDTELVLGFVVPKGLQAIEARIAEPTQEEHKNELILRELQKRIGLNLSDDKPQLRILQTFINAAEGDERKLQFIALAIAHSSRRYTVHFTAEILESLRWPDSVDKTKIIGEALADTFINNENLVNWQPGYVKLGPQNGFKTYNMVLVTKNIFGQEDFVLTGHTLPFSLYAAMGIAIRNAAEAAIADQQEKMEGGSRNDLNIGISLVLHQFIECRFPASLLAPLLPYLKDIPGLVGLELSDVGVRNPHDAQVTSEVGHGFKAENAEALLEVFRTNPYLFNVCVPVDGMTPDEQTEFMRKWGDIPAAERRAPTAQQMLALLAPTDQAKA